MFEWLTWGNIVAFLNSSFTSSLAGALAGAFFGAKAAQRIANHSKKRDELLQEIRATNTAIVASMVVCNGGLALKGQFVKEIHVTYTKKKEEHVEFLRKRATGEQSGNEVFEFQADFRTLHMPLVPIEVLRTGLYEKISATARPLALAAVLDSSISALSETIQKRNELIERFRQFGEAGMGQLPAFYFGLPYGAGHVSTEFSDAVESLNSQTDDVIFFSELLGKDLMNHGNKVLAEYKKIARNSSKKIHAVDFTDAQAAGLMPDSSKYQDWLHGFPNSL